MSSPSFDWSRPREALRYHHPYAGCGYNACEVCLQRDAGEYELAFATYLENGYAGDTNLPCGCMDADELERNDGHATLVDDFAAAFRKPEQRAALSRYVAWLGIPGNAARCTSCEVIVTGGSGRCDNCGHETQPYAAEAA